MARPDASDDDIDTETDEDNVNGINKVWLEYISRIDLETSADSNCNMKDQARGQQYRYYLPIELNGVWLKAMIDSGNSYANVMSEQLMRHLGLRIKDLEPTPGTKTVSTARTGAGMRILGRVKRPLRMKVHETLTFLIRPIVLKGLSMALNICGPFLQRHQIDQLHSEGCLKIKDLKLPLVAMLGPNPVNQPLAEAYPIFIKSDVTIPAMSTNLVDAIIPDAEALPFAFDGIVTGSEEFMEITDLHPWISTVNSCRPGGRLKVGIMNTLSQPVTVRTKQKYGYIYPTQTPHCLQGVNLLEHRKDRQKKETPERKTGLVDEEKREILLAELKLADSPFLKNPLELEKAFATLLPFWDLFSFDGSFGKTDLVQHQIKLLPGAKQPITQRYRPINPSLEPALRKQLKEWMDQQVVEKSRSPWNFGLVAAPKKNNQIRWCVDYRPLNQITVKDSHPIGNIEDNLVRLARSKIFSAIDGSGAFHVIELAPEDREKTAFATPWGSYQFRRMPFGLCNGPSTYARLVQMVLEGIPYTVALPYLDDTIIHSRNLDEHHRALTMVLEAHAKAGLRLQPSKCQLFRSEIEYLGHLVTADGLKPMEKYLKVVKDWPMPKTRSQVRVFLGKVGYYRRFIKDYAAIARPLTDLMMQNEKGDEEEQDFPAEAKAAFHTLKDKLLKAPILAYPQFDSPEPFILDTDWSQENNAIGGVLSQKQDGKERVIAYGAKKLNKAQAKYSSTKGELVAVIVFMRYWRYYLQFRKFVLRTDNRALVWIRTMEAPTGMIQRWLDTLSNFDFDVIHRPGKQHGNADALSRGYHLTPLSEEDTEVELGERLCNIVAYLENDWSPERLRELQKEDPDIQVVLLLLKSGTQPNKVHFDVASTVGKIYLGMFQSLHLDQAGLVRYSLVKGGPGPSLDDTRNVLLLPQVLWEDAMRQAHLASAHMGVQATISRAQRHVYFPGMSRVTQEIVRRCQECQIKRTKESDQRHTLVSDCQGYPFQKVCLDFIGPLPPSHRGNKYILTVKDTFSKWLEAFPTRRADTNTVVHILTTEVFPRFGLPDQLHSDRGTPFTSNLFQDVAKVLGIRATQTPAYNPKSNQVERAHRDLETALTALVGDKPGDWEKFLPHVLFAIRTSKNRTTGFAPYQLLFGRYPSSTLDLLFGTPIDDVQYGSHHEYAQQLQHRIQLAHQWAQDNIRKAVDRQRRAYHQEAKHFQEGTKVWLFTPRLRPGQSRKFARYWTGPWTIVKRINELMYRIAPDPTWLRKKDEVVSVDRLKLFHDDEISDITKYQPPPEDADLSMTGDEHAEQVLTHQSDDDDDDDGNGLNIPPPPPLLPQPPILPPPGAPQPQAPQPPQPVLPPPAPPLLRPAAPRPHQSPTRIPRPHSPRPSPPTTRPPSPVPPSPTLPPNIRPGGYLAREYANLRHQLEQRTAQSQRQAAERQQRYLRRSQRQQSTEPGPVDAGGRDGAGMDGATGGAGAGAAATTDMDAATGGSGSPTQADDVGIKEEPED